MESDHFIVHDKAFRNTPSNLQALEPKSRANYYHYLAGLSLSRVRDWNDITFAFHRLGLAVRAYPKTLLGKRLYILAIKIVFLVTLTPTFGKKTLSFLSTMKSSQSVEAFSANEAWALME